MSDAFCNVSAAAAEVFQSFGFIALVLQSMGFPFRNSGEIPEILEQLRYLFSTFDGYYKNKTNSRKILRFNF